MTIDPETYVFSFGKHKGKSYEDVLRNDPQYILWAHRKIEWFKLEDEEVELVEREALLKEDNINTNWLCRSSQDVPFCYQDDVDNSFR